jgi:hypothetical protein
MLGFTPLVQSTPPRKQQTKHLAKRWSRAGKTDWEVVGGERMNSKTKPMGHQLEQLRQEAFHLREQAEQTVTDTAFLRLQLSQTLSQVRVQRCRLLSPLDWAGMLAERLTGSDQDCC